MARATSKPKRFLVMRAKEVIRACAESGKALVIEGLDLCKRTLELESVDPVAAGLLFSFAYAKAIAAVKSAFFAAGVEANRSRRGPHACDGRGQ
ncbi:hypothetical protein [Candidatus Methylacidithermus pantelleriae]|uniref:Uncharacterized protein n=1 Tax=Candidatus Methylacidithermus pantelleriae TaxID=2744239 RepID=A0A8J2BMR6_9BACT|nr:hypothetical protein [Candidatus Methylacidithermus pantelleriae]CAF0697045.1 hypothetical protein MPNT_200039 [Candidatus Methylacidithermus pantelleriae]